MTKILEELSRIASDMPQEPELTKLAGLAKLAVGADMGTPEAPNMTGIIQNINAILKSNNDIVTLFSNAIHEHKQRVERLESK